MKPTFKTFPYFQVLTRPLVAALSRTVAEFAHVRSIRTVLCGILSLGLLVTATSSLAQGTSQSQSMLRHGTDGGYRQPEINRGVARRPLHINSNFPQVGSAAASVPKGATHLMVRSDADARQIFTYFPCPWVAARPGAVGVYRLEVNSQGTVAAVTILKSMGPRRDTRVMQTFVGWRAKPGPLRIVDISWVMSA